jgi:cobalt-zinc-cadmium efflux system membrane fusion protein
MKNRGTCLLVVLLAIAGIAVMWWAFRPEATSAASEHSESETHGGEEEGHEGGHEEEGHAEEGALNLKDSSLFGSGISLDTVRSRRLSVRLPLQGKIVLNEDRAVHVHPRFPGVILEVRKQLGSRVHKGEVLAVIESNENLQPYSLISRMDGTVVGRHASVGESVSAEDELFTVADLSTVWVDFQVYRQDFAKLSPGQRVRLIAEGVPAVEVRLAYLSPSTETHSQSLLARAELSNSGGVWTPGLFIRGEAAVQEFSAPSVRLDAVQQLPEGPVVFVRESKDHYEARTVRLGRRDGDFVELLEGPEEGAVYVSKNSFILKAELGKGEADHDH